MWNVTHPRPKKGIVIPLCKPPEGISASAMCVIKMRGGIPNEHVITAALVSIAQKGCLEIEKDAALFRLKIYA